MLPRPSRLHESADFRRVTRTGVRAGRPTLVLHASVGAERYSRVGFVVSRAVGGAVVRNRVQRRLRHLAAHELAEDARPTDVVVRALPAAASNPDRVATDLASAWTQASARLSLVPTRDAP